VSCRRPDLAFLAGSFVCGHLYDLRIGQSFPIYGAHYPPPRYIAGSLNEMTSCLQQIQCLVPLRIDASFHNLCPPHQLCAP
jgi:hypothetical protein